MCTIEQQQEYDNEVGVYVHKRNIDKALDVVDCFSFPFILAHSSPTQWCFYIPYSADTHDEIICFANMIE